MYLQSPYKAAHKHNSLPPLSFNDNVLTSGSDLVGRGLVRADVTWLHQCDISASDPICGCGGVGCDGACSMHDGARYARPGAPTRGRSHPWALSTRGRSRRRSHPSALHQSALHPSALHPSALHPSALHPSALRPVGAHTCGLSGAELLPTANMAERSPLTGGARAGSC